VGNPAYEWEEHLRDLLAELGFDEVVSYRLTTPEREARLGVSAEHVRVANPIAPERSVLRRSLLASVLDNVERNSRLGASLAFFEIGPVFEPSGDEVPAQPRKLALAMTGMRHAASWDTQQAPAFDFFDLKGRIELLLEGIGVSDVTFEPTTGIPYLHPGKAAEIRAQGKVVGGFGELHPSAKEQYEFGQPAVLVAEMDVEGLRNTAPQYQIRPVPSFPPVLEDIAIIVDESVAAARVESLIREAGGAELTDVHLFDIYRGEQVGAGKKSMAYSLTYQAQDKTMTDAEAAAIRIRVVKRLQQELGASLRG
jgi:phenylalanyl-tRNA synthetase beta chain